MVRAATADDVRYIAHGLAELAEHLRCIDDNPFVAELPVGVEASAALAATFVSDAARFALVAEREGIAVGSLAALVGPASVGWSQLSVGHIVCCWVEPWARNRGIARELSLAAEDEFRRRKIEYVELAYLTANADAGAAWARLGYVPHRVFALKRVQD